jgi:hypothetical protein
MPATRFVTGPELKQAINDVPKGAHVYLALGAGDGELYQKWTRAKARKLATQLTATKQRVAIRFERGDLDVRVAVITDGRGR